jgi:hypothetical protein
VQPPSSGRGRWKIENLLSHISGKQVGSLERAAQK